MHPLTESFWGWETEAQKGEGACPWSQELANCRFKIQSQVSLMPKPTHSCTTIYYGQIDPKGRGCEGEPTCLKVWVLQALCCEAGGVQVYTYVQRYVGTFSDTHVPKGRCVYVVG